MPKVTITINSEENDDWIRSLPGYADEVEITKAAAATAENKKPGKKSKKVMVYIGRSQ